MKLPGFDYARPDTLEDALALLSSHRGEAKALAGGQSLMPMLAFRLAAPRLLVDLARIPGLNRIAIGADGVRLGALVRWVDIERHPRLDAAHPLLAEAVSHVAHYQIRNRGTVGGSLAHADPAAEMPGIAVVCDADITVAGPRGLRTTAAGDFFTGALSTVLQPDELIVDIRLPAWPSARRWAFKEFARRAGDFALAGVALFYDLDSSGCVLDPHIAAIGVSDRPLRLRAAEAAIAGAKITVDAIRAAAAAAPYHIDIADDIHAPGDYRCALLSVLTQRALARAACLPIPEETS
jgi:aerobic carbon-monoxide dehydrogenase medium subunit